MFEFIKNFFKKEEPSEQVPYPFTRKDHNDVAIKENIESPELREIAENIYNNRDKLVAMFCLADDYAGYNDSNYSFKLNEIKFHFIQDTTFNEISVTISKDIFQNDCFLHTIKKELNFPSTAKNIELFNMNWPIPEKITEPTVIELLNEAFEPETE